MDDRHRIDSNLLPIGMPEYLPYLMMTKQITDPAFLLMVNCHTIQRIAL